MILEDLIKDFAAAIGAETPQEEMAIVKGFMTLSSAVIPTVQFKDRDHRNTRANLYYAVVGNAGSNKSAPLCRLFIITLVHGDTDIFE